MRNITANDVWITRCTKGPSFALRTSNSADRNETKDWHTDSLREVNKFGRPTTSSSPSRNAPWNTNVAGNAEHQNAFLLNLESNPAGPTYKRRLVTMRNRDVGYLMNLRWLGWHRYASNASTVVNRVTSTWSSRGMLKLSRLSGFSANRPSFSPSKVRVLPCPGMPRRILVFTESVGLSSSQSSVLRLRKQKSHYDVKYLMQQEMQMMRVAMYELPALKVDVCRSQDAIRIEQNNLIIIRLLARRAGEILVGL